MDMKKVFSFALAFMLSVFAVGAMSLVVEEISIAGQASASDLGDNITATLGEWLPLVLVLAFVGIALGYVGIRLGRK